MLTFMTFGLASYLLGGVPFGYLVGKFKGVDVRTLGSGNIGATNVARTLGRGLGALTFCCDVLKGFLCAWLFPMLAERIFACEAGSALALFCAVSAVAGHNWPVYLRFKGGKGIATSLGALLGVAPACAGLGAAAWVAVFAVSRYVSAASVFAALVAAAGAWFFYAGTGLLVPSALTVLAAFAVWRHRENLRRLALGTEPRFRFRSSGKNR